MALTNAYCSIEQVKRAAGIQDPSDTGDDELLEAAINAASRQIDRWCGQRFWADDDAVTREFYIDDTRTPVDLRQDDVAGIADVDDLEVKTDTAGTGSYATTLTVGTDFLLAPANAAVLTPARPYTSLTALSGGTGFARSNGRPSLQITAKWGWPVVPDEVVEACLLQSIQIWKAKDAPFGIAGTGEFGFLRIRGVLHEVAQGLLDAFRLVTLA